MLKYSLPFPALYLGMGIVLPPFYTSLHLLLVQDYSCQNQVCFYKENKEGREGESLVIKSNFQLNSSGYTYITTQNNCFPVSSLFLLQYRYLVSGKDGFKRRQKESYIPKQMEHNYKHDLTVFEDTENFKATC